MSQPSSLIVPDNLSRQWPLLFSETITEKSSLQHVTADEQTAQRTAFASARLRWLQSMFAAQSLLTEILESMVQSMENILDTTNTLRGKKTESELGSVAVQLGLPRDFAQHACEFSMLLLMYFAALDLSLNEQSQNIPNLFFEGAIESLLPKRHASKRDVELALRLVLQSCRYKSVTIGPNAPLVSSPVDSTAVCTFYDVFRAVNYVVKQQQCSSADVEISALLLQVTQELCGDMTSKQHQIDVEENYHILENRLKGMETQLGAALAIKCLHEFCAQQQASVAAAASEALQSARIHALCGAIKLLYTFIRVNTIHPYYLGMMQFLAPGAEALRLLNTAAQSSSVAAVASRLLQSLLVTCLKSSDLVYRFCTDWNYRLLYVGKSTEGSGPVLNARFLQEMQLQRKNLYDIFTFLVNMLQSGAERVEESCALVLRLVGEAFMQQCDKMLTALNLGDSRSRQSIKLSDSDILKARADLFMQFVGLIQICSRKGLVSKMQYLRLLSSIMNMMIAHGSYLAGSDKALAFIMFNSYTQYCISELYLLLDTESGKVRDEEHAAALLDLLARLARLEIRVLDSSKFASLWALFFKMRLQSKSLDTLIDGVLNAFSDSKRQLDVFSAYGAGLLDHTNDVLLQASNGKLSAEISPLIHNKSLRTSLKSLIRAIPSAQIVSCMQELISAVKKQLRILDKSTTSARTRSGVVRHILPLILLPISIFGFNVVIYENCYSELKDLTVSEGLPLVRSVFQSFVDNANQTHGDDVVLSASLQLYYAIRTVHNRTEEFSSDVYTVKPMRMTNGESGPARKQRRLDEDLLLDLGDGTGKTLDDLNAMIKSSEDFVSKSILCYIIAQRMYELNQQLMLQRYNFLLTSADGTGDATQSQQFQLQQSFYVRYFNFLMGSLREAVGKRSGDSSASWDGLVESISSQQELLVMLWKLITSNFAHILPNLDDGSLEYLLRLAFEFSQKELTKDESLETLSSVTSQFFEQEHIIDLERAQAPICNILFDGMRSAFAEVSNAISKTLPPQLMDQFLSQCKTAISNGDSNIPIESVLSSLAKKRASVPEHFASSFESSTRLLQQLPASYFNPLQAYGFSCMILALDAFFASGSIETELRQKLLELLQRLASVLGTQHTKLAKPALLDLIMKVHKQVGQEGASGLLVGAWLQGAENALVLDFVSHVSTSLSIAKGDDTQQLSCLSMLYRILNQQILQGTSSFALVQERQEALFKALQEHASPSSTHKSLLEYLISGEIKFAARKMQSQCRDVAFALHLSEVLRLLCFLSREFTQLDRFVTQDFSISVIQDFVLAIFDHIQGSLSFDASPRLVICAANLADVVTVHFALDDFSLDSFSGQLASRCHCTYKILLELYMRFSAQTKEAAALESMARRLVSKRLQPRQKFCAIKSILKELTNQSQKTVFGYVWMKQALRGLDAQPPAAVEAAVLPSISATNAVLDALQRYVEVKPMSFLKAFFDQICLALYDASMPFITLVSFVDATVRQQDSKKSHDVARRLETLIATLLDKIVRIGEMLVYALRRDAARHDNLRMLTNICCCVATALSGYKSASTEMIRLLNGVCSLIKTQIKLGFYIEENSPQVVSTVNHLVQSLFAVVLVGQNGNNITTLESISALYTQLAVYNPILTNVDILVMDLVNAMVPVPSAASQQQQEKDVDLTATEAYLVRHKALNTMFDHGLARFFKKVSQRQRELLLERYETGSGSGNQYAAARLQTLRYCLDRAKQINDAA